MMKLSFATLACPKWNLDKIIDTAKTYGFSGIDFRGYLGNLKIYETAEFSNELDQTVEKIKAAGLEVSAFSSSVQACSQGENEQKDFIREFASYAKLCKVFGTKFIRIFGGKTGARTKFECLKSAKRFLRELAKIAEDQNVEILIETHDDWIASADLLGLIECADSPLIGALWDVHHPYRFKNESPEETWKNIGKYVKNTHWKDSKRIKKSDGENSFRLCLCGEGDVPYAQIISVLKAAGYNSWLTFEWEKQWHPEIEEPEIAIPNFANIMKMYSGL